MCDSRPAVLRVFFLLRVRLHVFEQLFASMRRPDGFCAACWPRNQGGVARLLRCEALSAAEGTEECRGRT